ncbi:MAG: arginyltransferase [Acidobacteria bacterium]|nr:MAG: arginyltransferase [Acidobacteriota bacterium]
MSERIRDLIGDEEICPYLRDRRARMQYKLIDGCSAATYQRLLALGWRRFGRVFFRPICAGCNACLGLRVDVARFRPNRSMRRTVKKNLDLTISIGRPGISAEQLDLYHRYHAAQSDRRGWRRHSVSPADYYQSFIEGGEDFARELLIRQRERLLAVALFDRLPEALSAVYCYYDPDHRDRGLGVMAVLQEIGLAQRLKLPHLYLGYWIEDNRSMSYKARYRPHQILDGRPEEGDVPRWLGD